MNIGKPIKELEQDFIESRLKVLNDCQWYKEDRSLKSDHINSVYRRSSGENEIQEKTIERRHAPCCQLLAAVTVPRVKMEEAW